MKYAKKDGLSGRAADPDTLAVIAAGHRLENHRPAVHLRESRDLAEVGAADAAPAGC